MTERTENILFYGVPSLIVLIVILVFVCLPSRYEKGRKEMAPVYVLWKKKEYAKAVPMAGKMARLNNCDAQFFLYKLYLEGKHVKKNEDLAIKWLREAANSRHPAAMYYYGKHLADIDPAKSEFYLKAARRAGYKKK